MKKQLFIIVLTVVALTYSHGQKSIKLQTAPPWQILFRGIVELDTLMVKEALENKADINQAANGITPLAFLSAKMIEDANFSKKIELFNYLIAKGANYNLGYQDALDGSIRIEKQNYDQEYIGKTYWDLDFSNTRDVEAAVRSSINNTIVLLHIYSNKLAPNHAKNRNTTNQEMQALELLKVKSYLKREVINLDIDELQGEIINITPLDIIYQLDAQKHLSFPKVKKQFIESIEKNDVVEFKKLYGQYPLPFASVDYPDAAYAIFNNSPYRLSPSKEIVAFAIENGFDVNARIGGEKYGRLIEHIYNDKGKNHLSGEPEFEYFKTIYDMCLNAGLDMNFTYENGIYINGLILDIVKRGNKELFEMIQEQLEPNYYLLRFAIADKDNPLIDEILKLSFTPNQLAQAIYRIIDNSINTPDIHIVKRLLEKGANPNLRKKGVDENSHREYTMISAVIENKVIQDKLTYIELFENYGADINAPDIKSYGNRAPHNNPLYHIVKMSNTPEKLKLLGYFIEKGAYPISDLYKFDSEEDILECALLGPNENMGVVLDFLLDKNVKVTQSAIDRLNNMIKPKNCKTCKKRPELKPYLKKLTTQMN